MKKNLFILVLFVALSSYSQTGIIRGAVTDKNTERPLTGVTVSLSDNSLSTITDSDGKYILVDVAIGRQTVIFNNKGYESITIPNIDVTTGKDVEVNTALVETFNKLEEVVVTKSSKNQTRNKAIAVSGRQFGIEEVTRYSGGRSDVARLASNFAGVSAPDDSRNDIVVRGNSATGLLWRIEGIPVPSPNHFASLGTTGSPVSALNPNLLSNSDFITSAFPAEYAMRLEEFLI